MFTSLAAFTLFATALVARGEPTPNEPGPNSVYKEGATCHIAWGADPTGTWKTTNIELMTGDNFNMIHLTTVTTVDGTVDGTYDFPCPAVTPNSAIYFYQFSSSADTEKTWTTRFTIAGPNGETVPPANANQPGSNEPIPWGVGKLDDASKATPPPSGSGSSNSSSVPSSLPVSSSVSSSSALPTTSPLSSASPLPILTTALPSLTASRIATSTVSSVPTSTSSGTAAAANNGAMGSIVVDKRVWQGAVAVGSSLFAFAMLL